MSELGWPGIFIAEEHGGQELGTTELAILSEELGYALAPSPFLSNAAAGLLIAHAGSDEQKGRWLPGVASGEALGTVGVVTDGVAPLVPDAAQASFVVLVDGDRASVLEGVSAEPQDTIDSTRRYARVEAADGEPLEGDLRAGARPGGGGAVRRADRGRPARDGDGGGVRARARAVRPADRRLPGGGPPLRRDAAGDRERAGHDAVRRLRRRPRARVARRWPRRRPSRAPRTRAGRSRASSLQVHGGIGFTWEHDLHFFLKRAKADAHLYGSAAEHRERVADSASAQRSDLQLRTLRARLLLPAASLAITLTR